MLLAHKDITVKPLSVLYNSINRKVVIVCKDDSEITGEIMEVNEFMDIALRNYQVGIDKNIEKNKYLFIKGNIISFVMLIQ
jgi:small nuclear ribonucleoprotein (snRNP)-like protein